MKLCTPRLGLLVVFPLLAGCGGTGHVTGKVTYRGSPVPAGWVYFKSTEPGRNPVSVQLNEDGSFEADLPAGEMTVSVDNREWQSQEAAGGSAGGGIPLVPPNIPISAEARAKMAKGTAAKRSPEPRPEPKPGTYVPIPEKYYSVETSGLKVTIKGGTQTLNIELTD